MEAPTRHASSTDAVLDALRTTPNVTAAEVAESAGIGRSTATRILAGLHRDGRAQRHRTEARAAARWSLSTEPPATPDRLGKGQLAALVAEYMSAHPGEVLSPHQVARALGGRSPGAVGNALARLSSSGQVQVVSDRPLRYQATA